MEIDKLVDVLLAEDLEASPPAATTGQATSHPIGPAGWTPVADASGKRDELAVIALGGKSWLYLGRELTPEQIDVMPDDEIGKLYSKYQMRLGVIATYSLGKGVLQIYVQALEGS